MGGKQAILKRADHRFIELIEFVSHMGVPPFLRLRWTVECYHTRQRNRARGFQPRGRVL